jgi:hypothetical protein
MKNKSLYESKKRNRDDYEEHVSESSSMDDEDSKPSSRIIPIK